MERKIPVQNYDPQKAAEVWKRVQSPSPISAPVSPDPSDLVTMIADEWMDAVTYLHLSRHFRGKKAELLRRMSHQEQAHAACLKGIYTLITGRQPRIHVPPASRELPKLLLRRCYGREMHALSLYQQRSSDPEYGQVYARLANEEQTHCQILLQLLGSQTK